MHIAHDKKCHWESTRFRNPICNFFFIIEDSDIANNADDNRPYLSGKNQEVLNSLEDVSSNLFQ